MLRRCTKGKIMKIPGRTVRCSLVSGLLLALSLSASAYEVHILGGQGSESKALESGNYELAIRRLEARVKINSRYLDIQLTNLCTAYVAAGEIDKAQPVCDRAVEKNGRSVGVAYNSRGVLRALQGDYLAAMQDFEQAGRRSNYPAEPRYFGDRIPSMRPFTGNSRQRNDPIEVAAQNLRSANKALAATQDAESQTLSADSEN